MTNRGFEEGAEFNNGMYQNKCGIRGSVIPTGNGSTNCRECTNKGRKNYSELTSEQKNYINEIMNRDTIGVATTR